MAAAQQIRGWEFQDGAKDWRVLSTSGVGTWFAATSHRDGAALIRRIADLRTGSQVAGSTQPNVDLRATGVQVWIPIPETGRWTTADLTLAEEISAAARELALTPDPSVPQNLEWGIDTEDKATLLPFWQTLLYEDTEYDDLLDPLRRDPRVWFYPAAPRPLRDRIHFDVSVPAEIADDRVAAVRQSGAQREWVPDDGKVLLTDAEGNEVDYIPAGDIPAGGYGDGPETSDWRLPFGGMVFYPTNDFDQSVALADDVARVADETGLPLMIDIRPAGLMIGTGKDQWDDERFGETARRVQQIARDKGPTADPTRLRFIQVCIDAVDIPPVREFWRAVLGLSERSPKACHRHLRPSAAQSSDDLPADGSRRHRTA